MNTKADFNEVAKKAASLHTLRAIIRYCLIVSSIAFPASLLILSSSNVTDPLYSTIESIPFYLFIIALISLRFVHSFKKRLQKQTLLYKQNFIINSLHPKEYAPHSHVPDSLVRSTGFYPRWQSIKGNDLVVTDYRKVHLMFSHVLLTHWNGDVDVTDFNGTFISLECDHPIEQQMSIQIRDYESSDGIRTKNKEFNKKYRTTCNDVPQAQSILTPSFMEKLLQIDNHTKTKTSIKLCGNQILIMLSNNKELFELHSSKSLDAYYHTCQNNLNYILYYADIMIENAALFDQSRITEK